MVNFDANPLSYKNYILQIVKWVEWGSGLPVFNTPIKIL